MVKKNIELILAEIRAVFECLDENQVSVLRDEILKANKIVVCGAGRVGMAIRGFGMRLGHLGLNAFTLGDSVVPGIGKGDLFLVASGSGETQTIYDLVEIGKKNGSRVGLITGNPESRMGRMSGWIKSSTHGSSSKKR
jgi:6-phospho-3-hexuloisomerase